MKILENRFIWVDIAPMLHHNATDVKLMHRIDIGNSNRSTGALQGRETKFKEARLSPYSQQIDDPGAGSWCVDFPSSLGERDGRQLYAGS